MVTHSNIYLILLSLILNLFILADIMHNLSELREEYH